MPFSTFSVATAVTPSVIETYFSHYLNRGPLRQKPTAHISYHEGLRLIRQFLEYSSKHTVEELQAFTAQWVPAPAWVRTQDVEVPPQFLTRSANVLRKQLGAHGIDKVGGEKWWQWRRPESPLHAEWIEMKKDLNERKRAGTKCERVILYVHGGAYYFGSVDEHRYQMQRHARKLRARVLAPRYRLAPQFPFPCGLYDCIATYFYLLEHFEPSQILFAGDSAGGGMVLSMLVTLRDQGCPLPAGTILLSPWVDLTHSFPSVAGDGPLDYIPPMGFHHKPSMAWPPPPTAEEKAQQPERKFTQPVEQPFEVVELPATVESGAVSTKASRDNLREVAEAHAKKPPQQNLNQFPGFGARLELAIDDKLIILREQIQLYAKNELLTHPLVSPVQQPSLGGLPPMLIQVGGGELLRDEQIYLAHKAANPRAFPPSQAIMEQHDPQRIVLNQYPATDVQLQVWEDLCHVPHTLSFTRPAKYMYRSVAQFGAWALARAQHKGIEILDDDAVSVISDGSDNEGERMGSSGASVRNGKPNYGNIGMDGVSSSQFKLNSVGAVGKAGDELPPFKDHMIRQRVNRHGVIFPLPQQSEIACLHLDPDTIGAIKPGPVRKWLAKRLEHEQKFASEYRKLVKKKQKELKEGYDKMEDGEYPPPTALINRRRRGIPPEEKKRGKSWGLAMWSGWGSSHDEDTIHREEKAANEAAEEDATRSESLATTVVNNEGQAGGSVGNAPHTASTANLVVPGKELDAEARGKRRRSSVSVFSSSRTRRDGEEPRPRSSYRNVRDTGQASIDHNVPATPVSGSRDGGGSPRSPPQAVRGFAEHSRRSSNGSGIHSASRPGSSTMAATHSPSALNATVVPGSPTMPVLAPVPTASDIAKSEEAVKIPGTDTAFLNPDSNRPHNGEVAYPFKLSRSQAAPGRAPSPNPSTMTLDSNESVEQRRTTASEGGASGLAGPETRGDDPAISDGVSVEPAQRLIHETAPPGDVGSSPAAMVSHSQAEHGSPHGPASITTTLRPVSVLSDSTTLRQLQTTSPEADPVSPVDSPTRATDSAAAATTFKSRQGRFDSRDSRLGYLGADGMPMSAFPDRAAPRDGENSAPKTAPFKIRNPVYDPRVAASQAAEPLVQAQQASTAAAEAAKPAPFRMRHTVYDPKVAPNGSKGSIDAMPGQSASNGIAATAAANATKKEVMPSDADLAASNSSAVAAARAAGTSMAKPALVHATNGESHAAPEHPPPSPPRTNIAQTTVPPARPVIPQTQLDRDSDSEAPPPVPPKDESYTPVTNRSPSGSVSLESNLKRKAVGSTSNGSVTTLSRSDEPASPARAPTIGDLSFERDSRVSSRDGAVDGLVGRPGLESFVTASEGTELKGEQGRAF